MSNLKVVRQATVWPLFSSLGLHVLFVGSLAYASTIQPSIPTLIETGELSVVMVDMTTLAAPMTEEYSEIQQEAVVKAQPIQEEDITEPEPVLPLEPETIKPPEPEPIIKPDIILKPEPKPKPKPIVEKIKPIKKKLPPKVVEKSKSVVDNKIAITTSSVSKGPNQNKDIADQGKSSVTATPKITKQSKPTYPLQARRRNLEGVVKVKYDIALNGRLVNIKIISATPKNIFDREVKKALGHWTYSHGPANNLTITFKFEINGEVKISKA